VGTSQLLWNWEKAYQGDILLLGDAGINPCDYIFLNDRFNNLNGICTTRSVLHSLSARTGFVTTITPGMLSFNTKNESNAQIHVANMIRLGSEFSENMFIKKIAKDNAEKLTECYNEYNRTIGIVFGIKLANSIRTAGALWSLTKYGFKGAKAGIKAGIPVAKKTFHVMKNIKNYTEITKAYTKTVKGFKNTFSLAKGIKNAKGALKTVQSFSGSVGRGKTVISTLLKTVGVKTTEGGVKAAVKSVGTKLLSIKGALIILVGSILLDKLIDFLSYNNTVVLFPLMRNNIPYAPILSGEKLLPASSNVSQENINGDLTGTTTNIDVTNEDMGYILGIPVSNLYVNHPFVYEYKDCPLYENYNRQSQLQIHLKIS
jgi:hypothetical protein